MHCQWWMKYHVANTYHGVEEDVESGSSINCGKIHNCLELKRSHLKSRVTACFSVHRDSFVVKIVLLLRYL
jgi:hypothetical protein